MKISKNHTSLVNHLINLIDKNPKITLKQLSEQTDISPFYIQKMFKENIGISPKEYASFIKKNQFITYLKENKSITEAIYASGYESTSRLYEKSNQLLGMTPSEYKEGIYNQKIMIAVGECSLGSILVAQTEKGICAISLGDNPEILIEEIQKRFPDAEFIGGNKVFEETVAKVIGFIEHPQNDTLSNLSLDIQGTVFQQKVWKTLKEIPMGQTVTYSELAYMIGSPQAIRAVASACANNKIAIAIPCHRVIRKGGNLAGYRWGIERKEELLKKETMYKKCKK